MYCVFSRELVAMGVGGGGWGYTVHFTCVNSFGYHSKAIYAITSVKNRIIVILQITRVTCKYIASRGWGGAVGGGGLYDK